MMRNLSFEIDDDERHSKEVHNQSNATNQYIIHKDTTINTNQKNKVKALHMITRIYRREDVAEAPKQTSHFGV